MEQGNMSKASAGADQHNRSGRALEASVLTKAACMLKSWQDNWEQADPGLRLGRIS